MQKFGLVVLVTQGLSSLEERREFSTVADLHAFLKSLAGTAPRFALVTSRENDRPTVEIQISSACHSEVPDIQAWSGVEPRTRAICEFAARYRLSPTESRLLALAISGRTNDEAADALECARGTVGTYWNRIFTKTGERGQRNVMAALVRWLARWKACPKVTVARETPGAKASPSALVLRGPAPRAAVINKGTTRNLASCGG